MSRERFYIYPNALNRYRAGAIASLLKTQVRLTVAELTLLILLRQSILTLSGASYRLKRPKAARQCSKFRNLGVGAGMADR